MKILKENGFNWIRLRLFVDPTTEKGYSKDGFLWVGIHSIHGQAYKGCWHEIPARFPTYSDTWAVLANRQTPASWSNIHGSALEGKVYSYSNEVIKRFMAEGVCPDMVQVGNEINNGMMWPQGKITETYEPFAVLLRCATAGVRAANPDIKIMIHIACGGQMKNR